MAHTLKNTAKAEMEEIINHFKLASNGGSTEAFYSVIIGKINQIVKRDPPWSHRVIYNVLSGKPIGEDLYHAVMAMVFMLDDVHPLVARSKRVTVLALGNVLPGTVVLADSVICAYPPCNLLFVPRVPAQRYCSREHQVRNYNLKRGKP
jgi:hypothetical protein